MKQVPACEYNPFEAVQTNVLGAQHVVDCRHRRRRRAGRRPLDRQGGEPGQPLRRHQAVRGEDHRPGQRLRRPVDHPPVLRPLRQRGRLPGLGRAAVPASRSTQGRLTITDERMTRFWITLPQAVDLVLFALEHMVKGGRDLHPQDPLDADDRPGRGDGPRRSRRGHRHPSRREAPRGPADRRREPGTPSTPARSTWCCPSTPGGPTSTRWIDGKPLDDDFVYSSDTNDWWLDPGRAPGRIVPEPMIPYGRQSIDDDDIAAVVGVLKGDWLTRGPAVETFEAALAERVERPPRRRLLQRDRGPARRRGRAAGLGPGDRVATSPLSFAASANCARYVGADAGLRRHRPGDPEPRPHGRARGRRRARRRALRRAPGRPDRLSRSPRGRHRGRRPGPRRRAPPTARSATAPTATWPASRSTR